MKRRGYQPKPWALQTRFRDEQDFLRLSYLAKKKQWKFSWENHGFKYPDLDTAYKHLTENKDMWLNDKLYKNKEWRMYNEKTGEIALVVVEAGFITII